MKDIIDLVEEYGGACADVEITRLGGDAYESVKRRPEQILNLIRAKLLARGTERRKEGKLRDLIDAILKRREVAERAMK